MSLKFTFELARQDGRNNQIMDNFSALRGPGKEYMPLLRRACGIMGNPATGAIIYSGILETSHISGEDLKRDVTELAQRTGQKVVRMDVKPL